MAAPPIARAPAPVVVSSTVAVAPSTVSRLLPKVILPASTAAPDTVAAAASSVVLKASPPVALMSTELKVVEVKASNAIDESKRVVDGKQGSLLMQLRGSKLSDYNHTLRSAIFTAVTTSDAPSVQSSVPTTPGSELKGKDERRRAQLIQWKLDQSARQRAKVHMARAKADAEEIADKVALGANTVIPEVTTSTTPRPRPPKTPGTPSGRPQLKALSKTPQPVSAEPLPVAKAAHEPIAAPSKVFTLPAEHMIRFEAPVAMLPLALIDQPVVAVLPSASLDAATVLPSPTVSANGQTSTGLSKPAVLSASDRRVSLLEKRVAIILHGNKSPGGSKRKQWQKPVMAGML